MSDNYNSKIPVLLTAVMVLVLTPLIAIVLPDIGFGLDPPSGSLAPYQIVLALINGIAFSLGIAFTLVMITRLRDVRDSLQTPIFIIYVTLAWELISWGIHDWFHIASGGDNFWEILLNIELAFHVTIQTAAILAGIQIIRILRDPGFTNEPTTTTRLLGIELSHGMYLVIGTVLITVASFFVVEPLTPPSNDFGAPPESLGIYFLMLYIFDCLTFAFGVAFILLAFSLVRKVVPRAQTPFVSFIIAVGWLAVSALFHVRFHLMAGNDIPTILVIDYSFHVTLIVASVIAAIQFNKLVKSDLTS